MTLGGRLREVREYLCLSVADGAAAAGLDDDELVAIESDALLPDELALHRLAHAYGHPPAYFRQPRPDPAPSGAGVTRLLGDLTEADRAELDRFTEFLRDTAGYW
jgi:transcriptional regulator with XRE-family HTH domain